MPFSIESGDILKGRLSDNFLFKKLSLLLLENNLFLLGEAMLVLKRLLLIGLIDIGPGEYKFPK
jgi:hypothetical protein